jgi:hypothetical protein
MKKRTVVEGDSPGQGKNKGAKGKDDGDDT